MDVSRAFFIWGDTLDGDGEAGFAATDRIRNGWMRFRDIFPFLTSRALPLEMKGRVYASCVRSSMTYGNETMPLLTDVGLKFGRAVVQIILCNVYLFSLLSISLINLYLFHVYLDIHVKKDETRWEYEIW